MGRFRKKRRTMKRRRARTVTASSTRQLNPITAFKFTARKMKKSAYRRLLWNSTQLDPHYRSVFTGSQFMTTPSNVNGVKIFIVDALSSVQGNEFWKTNGGLEDINFGETVPWAVAGADPQSCIIRGGRLWSTIAIPSTVTEAVNVRIQLVFLRAQWRNAGDSGVSNTLDSWVTSILANPRPIGYDMATAPDADEYMYKPVLDKQMDLKPGDSMSVYYKLKPTKVDCGSFQRGGAPWFPVWLTYSSQLYDVDAAGETISWVTGHNLSFSVGAIGN